MLDFVGEFLCVFSFLQRLHFHAEFGIQDQSYIILFWLQQAKIGTTGRDS